jgi:outer membrane receptor for ferrienterochelin and colicins
MRLKGLRRHAYVASVLWLAFAATAAAQVPRNLGEVPLEELMELRVQQIFGASDRLQPVTEVPSSVTIVTAEDISRFGYRTVADILRGVRGFYITDDRNYSYVGARGLNRPGDYNTRILLLVNGIRLNDNVFEQASVGSELGIDAAMFERVEIIRGPASSLYGTNALFAIVNVITRTGASLNGGSLDVDAGTLGTGLVRGSGGRRLENGTDFALSGTFERSTGVRRLFMPHFDTADTNGGVAEDLDGEKSGQLYGRLSLHNLTVTGTFGRRIKLVPTASFFTAFNEHDPALQTTDQHATVSAQYVRTLGASRVTTELSLDQFRYNGIYPYSGEEPLDPAIAFRDGSNGVRWNLGSRVTRSLPGRQTLTLGGEFVHNVAQQQFGSYAFTSIENFDINRPSRQGALYVQDEIRLRPWLLVNGGLRHDRYAHFDRTTPRGAVIVMPAANQSIKYLYGQAFRAPNAYELYYYRDASAHLQPESIGTHEWMWEGYFGERVRTAMSTYRYEVSQLVDLKHFDPDAIRERERFGFVNGGTIRAAGLELEAEMRLMDGTQALVSYALQDAKDVAPDSPPLTNSPRHLAKGRVSTTGPHGLIASFEWQYLSSRSTLAGTTLGAASVANVNMTWPLGTRMTVTGQIRNLLDARYADPGSEEHPAPLIEQNGRTLRVGLRWTLWDPR